MLQLKSPPVARNVGRQVTNDAKALTMGEFKAVEPHESSTASIIGKLRRPRRYIQCPKFRSLQLQSI